jgi:hypothetical protein
VGSKQTLELCDQIAVGDAPLPDVHRVAERPVHGLEPIIEAVEELGMVLCRRDRLEIGLPPELDQTGGIGRPVPLRVADHEAAGERRPGFEERIPVRVDGVKQHVEEEHRVAAAADPSAHRLAGEVILDHGQVGIPASVLVHPIVDQHIDQVPV